jgi:hypothetical protein
MGDDALGDAYFTGEGVLGKSGGLAELDQVLPENFPFPNIGVRLLNYT